MQPGERIAVKMTSGKVFRWEISEVDVRCQRCGAPVLWATTHNGKQMQINVPALNESVTTSHFDTCQSQLPRV